MRIDQIQIITTPEEIQGFIDKAVMADFEKLSSYTTVNAINIVEQPITIKKLLQFLPISVPTLIRWKKVKSPT